MINPPLTLPTYMEINNTSACSPLIENVNGRESAINIAPVKPGIAPTVTPSSDPSTTSSSAVGVNITSKTGCKSGIN